jgi:hypothetical protein
VDPTKPEPDGLQRRTAKHQGTSCSIPWVSRSKITLRMLRHGVEYTPSAEHL